MSQSLPDLIKTKRFIIPDELVPKLREIQAKSKQIYNDKITESEDVVIMTLGMGDAMYLAFDGRVIIWEDETFHPEITGEAVPREAQDVKEMFIAITIGAKKKEMPELLTLFPERPPQATDCLMCNPSGWRQFGIGTDGEPVKIICDQCGGTGWLFDDLNKIF